MEQTSLEHKVSNILMVGSSHGHVAMTCGVLVVSMAQARS